jgi:hypothetical protein
MRVFRINESEAARLGETLVAKGWAERAEREQYALTPAAKSLSCAKAVPRIDRSKADKLLADFLKRVDLVNDNDDLVFYVAEVRLFGSYIDPTANDFGDIDIALNLVIRPIVGRDWKDYATRRADSRGKSPYRYGEDHGRDEVRAILKARSPYLSLASMVGLEQLETKSQPLFRFSDDRRQSPGWEKAVDQPARRPREPALS